MARLERERERGGERGGEREEYQQRLSSQTHRRSIFTNIANYKD